MATAKIAGRVPLLAAALMFPATAPASEHEYCVGLLNCGNDKVAVVRCETDSNGSIVVRNSSVTSATGVTVRRGSKCAATVSALLQAGLRMVSEPTVTSGSAGNEVSFNFVFVGGDGYYDDDHDDRANSSRNDDDD